MSELQVDLVDEQTSLLIDSEQFRALIERAAALAGYKGTLSVALVDDTRMAELHAEFMDINEPTDVLSFPLDEHNGEVVISTDTAMRNAAERNADALTETLLYAVHGMLHLLDFDDHDDADRAKMQAEERRILTSLGFERAD